MSLCSGRPSGERTPAEAFIYKRGPASADSNLSRIVIDRDSRPDHVRADRRVEAADRDAILHGPFARPTGRPEPTRRGKRFPFSVIRFQLFSSFSYVGIEKEGGCSNFSFRKSFRIRPLTRINYVIFDE